jgi:hypothetical protein
MAQLQKFTNNASATSSTAIAAADLSIVLNTGQGASFPTITGSEFFIVTIKHPNTSALEIVKVTARSSDTLTVVRAQEGTTALDFPVSSIVELRPTAGSLDTLYGYVDTTVAGSTVVHTSGAETIAGVKTFSSDVILASLNGGPLAGSRSRTINGDMRFDHRNRGASVTPTTSTAFTLDRWGYRFTQASKVSIQQNAGSVTPPAGFTNYLGVTSLSAYTPTSTDSFWLRQGIEGYNVADMAFGTADASTITLSFWVRSSLTGTHGGTFNNASINRSYPFTFTISAANTWEYKTVSITGDTAGTWSTTTGTGIFVGFNLGAGSTYSATAGAWSAGEFYAPTGAVNVVATNGATFYVTGVQLEKGSTATPFERVDYGEMLRRCRRYLPATIADSATAMIGDAFAASATDFYLSFVHPVEPRVIPTGVTVSNPAHFTANPYSGSAGAVTAVALQNGGRHVSRVRFTSSGMTGGATINTFMNTAGAYILFDGCEL